ncbi:hypothetical protein HK102_005657, partial [Quaeritorhiza haematococci]
HLRLGAIYLDGGKVNDAQDCFKDVFVMDPKYIGAWLMLGNSQNASKAYRVARKTYEKVLQDFDRHDVYALCAVGNLNLHFARSDPKQKDIHYKRAFEFFDKALRLDNQNYCAAIGVGITLAENGKLEDAERIFEQIQASTGNPSASVNLAHIFVEKGDVKRAIPLYESVLKKHYDNRDAYLFQCLAKAYYIVAKSEKNPDAMLKALGYIQRAIVINPKDLALMYDVALIKQQYAQVLNEQSIENRPLAALRKAQEGLHSTRVIFAGLGARSAEPHPGYDIKHAIERAKYSEDVGRVTKRRVHECEVFERQREERMKEIRELQRQREEKEAEEQRKKLEEQEREKERIERERRQILAKVQEDNERTRLIDEEPVRKPSKRGGKSSENFIDDDDEGQDMETEEGGGGAGEKKRKRLQKRKKKSKPSGDDDDDLEPKPVRRKRPLSGDEDEDEDGGEDRGRKKGKKASSGIKSSLSAEFVEDSDEDLFGKASDDEEPFKEDEPSKREGDESGSD